MISYATSQHSIIRSRISYLEFELNNILKAFRQLRMLEPRVETTKGLTGKNSALLRIHLPSKQRQLSAMDCVILDAEALHYLWEQVLMAKSGENSYSDIQGPNCIVVLT